MSQKLIYLSQIQKGRVNTNYEGLYQNQKVFIKHNAQQPLILELENQNLSRFSNLNLTVPQPLLFQPNGTLVLPYLNFESKNQQSYTLLAQYLAQLHSHTQSQFGYDYPSFNARTQLDNTPNPNWIDFFHKTRWQPLFEKMESEPEHFNIWIKSIKISDRFQEIFNEVDLKPSLLHGDLNLDNWGQSDGKVYLFDLCSFYGHNWYDLICLLHWIDKPSHPDHKYVSAFIKTYNSCVEPYLRFNYQSPIIDLYRIYIDVTSSQLSSNTYLLTRAEKLMDKVISRCQKIYPSLIKNSLPTESGVIVVQGGSYNPPHTNHIRNLQLAKVYIEQHMKQKVVKLVMSLASDERINKKCNNGYGLHQRYHMLKAVADPHSISIDLSQLFGQALINYWRQAKESQVYFVCGTDTVEYNYKYLPQGTNIIVIARKGYSRPNFESEYIHWVDNDDEVEMSSTQIRNAQNSVNWYLCTK